MSLNTSLKTKWMVFMLIAINSLSAYANEPIKALLVAGGCCHDYGVQHLLLSEGIQKRANVQVDVWWTDDKGTNPPLDLYNDPNWAKGYDVIIHDECAAGNKDLKVMENVLNAHKTIPSVHLHCAMHSFRNGTDLWAKHLGLLSSRHGPQAPININFTDSNHEITNGLTNWTTINEELYNNVELHGAKALAKGSQTYKNKTGEQQTDESIVVWTNEMMGVKSFSTTLGHNNATVEDSRYLDLVTRGLLWSCNKLNDEYLVPFKGENKVTFVAGQPAPPKPQAK